MIRLSQKGRPTEVNVWLKNSEDPNIRISETVAFGAAWIAWWVGCQPAARSPNSRWPLPQAELQHSDWGKMLHGGKNGIFLFIMALSWWANGIDSAQPPSDFCSAVADLEWVLKELHNCLASPPTPSLAPESSLGKRRVRLSERASEAPMHMKKMFDR